MPVSVSVLPAQSVVADAVAVTVEGTVLMIIDGVVADVLPHTLVAVKVYTPADSVEVTKPAGLSTADE